MKRLAGSERVCASPWCERPVPWWRRDHCTRACANDHAAYLERRAA